MKKSRKNPKSIGELLKDGEAMDECVKLAVRWAIFRDRAMAKARADFERLEKKRRGLKPKSRRTTGSLPPGEWLD